MRQFIFLLLILSATTMKAQFGFDFYPRQQQQEQRREKSTTPMFKGGDKGVQKYVEKHFKQPKERDQIDGRILVAIIVNPKGNVEQAQVIRSVSPTLDKEALRVAKSMKFKPAQQGKKRVRGRVDISFPIRNGRLTYNTLPTVEV